MKADLIVQSSLDQTDGVFSVEECLQLSTENIMSHLNNKVTAEKRRRQRKAAALYSIMICIMLIAAVNWRSIYTYASELMSKFIINDGGKTVEIEMVPIDITWPEKMDETGESVTSKSYSSLEDVSEDLNIEFLKNPLAWEMEYNNKVNLTLPIINNLAWVNVSCFAVGDLQNISLTEGGICFQPGERYKNSVDLTISFLINGVIDGPSTLTEDFQNSVYVETYTSARGREVMIYSSGDFLDAIFYDNNMEYNVSGLVSMEVLKEIIDAFE